MYIKQKILATLAYFNMFDYPLKKREVFTFLGTTASQADFENALNSLVEEAAIFKMSEFYSLSSDTGLVQRRLKGNAKAALMLKQADAAATIIAAFPFVKGVAVSGSLSKNFAAENADIDFFIITQTGRLWLSRTFLHLFKKLTYMFGMQHRFCMNYFIAEDHPVILEKNIYTATEVTTVLTLRGNAAFDRFYSANGWTKKFLPNNYLHASSAKDIRFNWMRRLLEFLLNNRLGDKLDDFFMSVTSKSWNRKTRHLRKDNKGIPLGLHTGKHFSKPDPVNFQKRLLLRYESQLLQLMDYYESATRLKNELR